MSSFELAALDQETLLAHVRMLADQIGPRPAGQAAEEEARSYIRRILAESGIAEIEEIQFPAPNTWAYGLVYPVLLSLFGQLLPPWLGSLAGFGSAYALWCAAGTRRQPLSFLALRKPSATLIARIMPSAEPKRRVVLLAHTDSNKHRPTFSKSQRQWLRASTTTAIGLAALGGLAQLARAFGLSKARAARILSVLGMLTSLALLIADEFGGHVPGANDNATAVASVLGLGAALKQQPLRNTEVWLCFTGAEEVGCLGTHALLDTYGEQLKDAWFLDIEMVGAGSLVYLEQYTGFSYITTQRADPESLAWAAETAQHFPEFGAKPASPVIGCEVDTLRLRGFRGICLAGIDQDGWLINWHRDTDATMNIEPAALKRAAEFALAMVQTLDRRPHTHAGM